MHRQTLGDIHSSVMCIMKGRMIRPEEIIHACKLQICEVFFFSSPLANCSKLTTLEQVIIAQELQKSGQISESPFIQLQNHALQSHSLGGQKLRTIYSRGESAPQQRLIRGRRLELSAAGTTTRSRIPSQATARRGTGTTSLAREDEGAPAAKLPPSRVAAAAAEDPAPKHPPRLRRARRRDGASARLLPAPISLALFPPSSSPSERKRERVPRWG